MLTWDEEVKPSLQNALTSSLPSSRSMDMLTLDSERLSPSVRMLNDGAYVSGVLSNVAPSAQAVAAAVEPKAAVPAVMKRVKASDKRIINGQTDVNQLVPFKYCLVERPEWLDR